MIPLLQSVPLWGYFIVLGAAFLAGHVWAFRPDPRLGRGRRMAGRWGSSLLLLVGLLLVSNRSIATVASALLLALAGGILSGRTAPLSARGAARVGGAGRPHSATPPERDDAGTGEDEPADHRSQGAPRNR